MCRTFTYETLRVGEFRLLTINYVDESPVCTLKTFPINDAPDYDALSYVWGETISTRMIICNGDNLPIRANLFDAFTHLHRFQKNANPPRKIWIDAICINQQNHEEKNVCVALMKDVYKSAMRVLIWLGNAADDSDMAMDNAVELTEKLTTVGEHIDRDYLISYGLEPKDHPIWGALGHLYQRTWFERLWVVQEAVLAEALVVLCGAKWIDWQIFPTLATALLQCSLLTLVMGASEIRPDRDDGFVSVVDIDQMRSEIADTDGMGLYWLLNIGRSKRCTEPVDRIWGMLSLVRPETQSEILSQVKIDYSDSGREQFWKPYLAFAKWHIQKDSSLMMFSVAPSREKPFELPSWCPNWASTVDYTMFGDIYSYHAGFRNIHDRGAFVRTIAETTNIQVPGFRVDEVTTVISTPWSFSKYPHQQVGPDGAAARLMDWESQCLSLSQATYRQPDSVPEAHWRTLIGNRRYSADTAPVGDVSESYRDMKRYLVALRDGGRTLDKIMKRKKASMRGYFSTNELTCQGRRFFSTRGGRIGIGPADVQVGDVVCVFRSGVPLYILRYRAGEDIARLIGDAYVHGLMNAEGFTTNT